MHTQTIAARCVKSERYRKWRSLPWCSVHKPFRIFCFSGLLTCFSAVHAQHYSYKFAVEGITDPAGAKMITDILRPVFNHSETPFAVFPAFDDALDLFVFSSDRNVSRETLENVLGVHNREVLSFQSVPANGKVVSNATEQ